MTTFDDIAVVSPNRAMEVLDLHRPRLYALINSGQLETFKIGKSRKITVRSIKKYIEGKLAETQAATAA